MTTNKELKTKIEQLEELIADNDHRITTLSDEIPVILATLNDQHVKLNTLLEQFNKFYKSANDTIQAITQGTYTKAEVDKLGAKCKEVDDKQWKQINELRRELRHEPLNQQTHKDRIQDYDRWNPRRY